MTSVHLSTLTHRHALTDMRPRPLDSASTDFFSALGLLGKHFS